MHFVFFWQKTNKSKRTNSQYWQSLHQQAALSTTTTGNWQRLATTTGNDWQQLATGTYQQTTSNNDIMARTRQALVHTTTTITPPPITGSAQQQRPQPTVPTASLSDMDTSQAPTTPTTPPQPTSLQALLHEKDERITLLLSRIDSLLEEIEHLTTENKALKNDLSQVAELLELPEPYEQAIKFLSSFLTTFDPSVPLITTTRPTANRIMGDQEFWVSLNIDTYIQL